MGAHQLKFTHRPGRHCGSTALHNAMVYHGVDFSEAVCFGLACGLSFGYLKLEGGTAPRIFTGRTRTLETDFFETLRHPWTWNVEDDAEGAWRKVAAWVDRDVPVMLSTDLYYLDYYKTSTHFAGHSVLLVGYDEDRGLAWLSDTDFETVQEVSLSALTAARTSEHLPMPLEYHWHQIERPASLPPLRQMMIHALRRTADAMLHPGAEYPVGPLGVAGLRTLAEDFPRWPEDLHGDWSWATRFCYQLIERRGTGGGLFRYLYADFLEEVEREVPELRDVRLSDDMRAIAARWRDLASTLKTLSETSEAGRLFETAAEQAAGLAEAEHAFCERVLHQTPGD